jgi:hypothetical protein
VKLEGDSEVSSYLAISRLKVHGAFQVVCDEDLVPGPTTIRRIRDLNRRFGHGGLPPTLSHDVSPQWTQVTPVCMPLPLAVAQSESHFNLKFTGKLPVKLEGDSEVSSYLAISRLKPEVHGAFNFKAFKLSVTRIWCLLPSGASEI